MFSNCINIIKLTLKHNKKGFIINNNKNNLNVIKAFIKINVIKFIIIKNNKIIVYLNYHNDKPVFYNITNLYKSSNKKFISLKNLKKLSLKYNWIFLISSSKGLINNYEAINLNVGGLIIAKIWN